jgi:hypothetical protein
MPGRAVRMAGGKPHRSLAGERAAGLVPEAWSASSQFWAANSSKVAFRIG